AAFLTVPALLRWMAGDVADIDGDIRQVVLYRLDAIVWGVIAADLLARKSIPALPRLVMLVAGLVLIAALWGGLIHLPRVWDRTFATDLVGIAFALCLPAAELLRHAWRWFAALARMLSSQSYALYLMHLSILQALDIAVTRHRLELAPAAALALTLP